MLRRRVTLEISDKTSSWTEKYIEGNTSDKYHMNAGSFPEGTENLEEWSREMLQNFNNTRRPGEVERALVSFSEDTIEVLEASDDEESDLDDEDLDDWDEDEDEDPEDEDEDNLD